MLAFVTMLAALAVAIVQNAGTFADISRVLAQMKNNANLAIDLLQELLQEIPFGTQMGYLLDVLLQKKIANPFRWNGFSEVFLQGIAIAALTNLFSQIIAPQRAVSSALHAVGFEYLTALMHVVNNALAVISVFLLQKTLPSDIWLLPGAAVVFALEIVILFWRIKKLSFSRICTHVIVYDVVGFLFKQLVMCLFLSAVIHILQNDYPKEVWEYAVCVLLVVGTTPLLEGIDAFLKAKG